MENRIDKHSQIPIFEQVQEMLREKIASGFYKPDRAIPDERSMAKNLGLSRMTVRRAIMGLVREGLLTRVRGRGTFVRGAFAPRERRGRPPVLGVVSKFNPNQIRNSLFCHRILAGIQMAAEEADLLLAFRRVTDPHEALLTDLRQDTALKGLILLEMDHAALMDQLGRLPIPSVLVDTSQPDPKHPTFNEVNHDCRDAMREAVGSLIRLGHRDIALLIFDQAADLHNQRRKAFNDAFHEHQLPVPEHHVCNFDPNGHTAYALTKKMLQEEHPPTAIVCAGGDELSLGAMAAVQQLGLHIPRDVSMISYGDTLIFTVPLLSTIRVPWEDLGEMGVRVLLERFRQPTAPIKRVFLPCEFVTRGSIDTPRSLNVPQQSAT